MTRSLSNGWAVLAVTLGFVACGGTSTLRRSVPTGDDDDDTVVGTGGTTGHAGGAGKAGQGGTVAKGGTTAKGGSTATGGTGAKGGTTGKGGTTSKGGAAGKGGSATVGGTAGIGGDDGLNADPNCTCTRTGSRSVDCSTATVTVPNVFQNPNACAALDTRTKRTYCDDGAAYYTFIEGEENEYHLELNHSGTATYFSASGYVAPGCGLDPNDFDLAEVTQGTPGDASCFESCALCGPYDDLPACEACEHAPNDPDTSLETLAQFCENVTCPANFAALQAEVDACVGDSPPRLRAGCGTIEVSFVTGFSEHLFVFDASTGALVGARRLDDFPSYPCQTSTYVAGTIPDGSCSSVQTCNFCTQGGEAGAGGAPGAAGAGDGSLCPL